MVALFSIVSWLIVSPVLAAVVTIHHSGRAKQQVKSLTLRLRSHQQSRKELGQLTFVVALAENILNPHGETRHLAL